MLKHHMQTAPNWLVTFVFIFYIRFTDYIFNRSRKIRYLVLMILFQVKIFKKPISTRGRVIMEMVTGSYNFPLVMECITPYYKTNVRYVIEGNVVSCGCRYKNETSGLDHAPTVRGL